MHALARAPVCQSARSLAPLHSRTRAERVGANYCFHLCCSGQSAERVKTIRRLGGRQLFLLALQEALALLFGVGVAGARCKHNNYRTSWTKKQTGKRCNAHLLINWRWPTARPHIALAAPEGVRRMMDEARRQWAGGASGRTERIVSALANTFAVTTKRGRASERANRRLSEPLAMEPNSTGARAGTPTQAVALSSGADADAFLFALAGSCNSRALAQRELLACSRAQQARRSAPIIGRNELRERKRESIFSSFVRSFVRPAGRPAVRLNLNRPAARGPL